MLELACALESNLTVEARRAADELMKTVRRKYAERPDLSFAHVVARLTSADIRARDQIGEPLSATQKARLRSAIAERAACLTSLEYRRLAWTRQPVTMTLPFSCKNA